MARRRRTSRAPARRAPARRARPRKNRLMDFDIKDNVISAGYGAVRGYVSALNPLKNLLGGMGGYADEVGMFLGLQAVKAFSSGEIRRAAKIGQNVESALVGFQLSKGLNTGTKTEGSNETYYQ